MAVLPAGPTGALERSRVPSRDYIDPEATGTTSIRNHPSRSSTQWELRSYSKASFSETKIHSEDASVFTTRIHSEDFRIHSSDRSAMRSSQISKSIACHDFSSRSRHCTTQVLVTILQLSVQLWIRMDSSAYPSKQPWRIKTVIRSANMRFKH